MELETQKESLQVRAYKVRNRVQNAAAGMFMPADARAAINAMAEILAEVAAEVVDLREQAAPAKAALEQGGGNG